MEPMIYWGNILRSLRLKNNLTQKEVAGILHITRQTYSCYETGRSRPTPETIAILSKIYGVNLYEYVTAIMPPSYVAEQTKFISEMPKNPEEILQRKAMQRASKKRKANTSTILPEDE